MSQTGLFFTPTSSSLTLAQAAPFELLVPLKKVEVGVVLEGALATLNYTMTYENPSDKPIETTYEYPIEADTVVSAFAI